LANKIRQVKGMPPVLPESTPNWQYVESKFRHLLQSSGYAEIRMPLLEHTELFKRSIGEVTDIVEKEMYTFDDLNGKSLTLRPEGTAGCVRTAIDNGLLHNQKQRLWYAGPMFRHENTQAGRYRQFHQIGVEAFGFADTDIELEHLVLVSRLWKELGLANMTLELNTLGTSEERLQYKKILVDYFQQQQDLLDEDSIRRLGSNPLRILDSKNPQMAELIGNAPVLLDHLGEESTGKFNRLLALLDKLQIAYTVNTRLVRGLDYYCHTVYEWTTNELGAQSAVCAGGRFDGLVEQLGGRAGTAVGFAMGIERLIMLLEKQNSLPEPERPDIYLVMLGDQAQETGFVIAETLRDAIANIRVIINCGGGNMKAQIKRADKSGAELALFLGEDEVNSGQISIKYLREEGKQIKIDQQKLVEFIRKHISQRTG